MLSGDSPVPAHLTPEHVYAAIADVLDPELDTPLIELGFVDRVEIAGPDVTLFLKLPTFWCAPNFAYLMATDLAERVRALPGSGQVQVLLLDHFAGEEISRGVNRGLSFAEAFPGEVTADEDLQALRHLFLRKGFLMRQDLLLRRLLQSGLDGATLSTRRVEDLQLEPAADRVLLTVPGGPLCIPALARQAQGYLERGRRLGLLRPGGYLFVDEEGRPIPEGDVKTFLQRLRSVRLSIMFNTAMCRSLFRTRYQHAGAETAHLEGASEL